MATPRGLWDLSSLTRIEPGSSAVKAPSPDYWNAREFPKITDWKLVSKPVSAVPIRVTGTEEADNKYLTEEEKSSSNIILIIYNLYTTIF